MHGLRVAMAKGFGGTKRRLWVPMGQQVIERQGVVLDTFRQVGEVKADRPLADAFVLKL